MHKRRMTGTGSGAAVSMVQPTWLGGLAGAAAGAIAGALLGTASLRTMVATGAAVGATLGAAAGAAAMCNAEPEPWWHDEKNVRTFDDVAKDDAAFRSANSAAISPIAEAQALHRLFESSSSAALREACEGQAAMLASARARWEPWAAASHADLGAAVSSAVRDLDAPHLLPSGIEQRLLQGVAAARFGLFTLMKHEALDEPKGR